jgi:hypothetical protein
MKYAIEQRLRFIDFLLDRYGKLNRSELMDYYGISKPQATEDIRQYIALAPDNLKYDIRARHYYAQEGFKRVWP